MLNLHFTKVSFLFTLVLQIQIANISSKTPAIYFQGAVPAENTHCLRWVFKRIPNWWKKLKNFTKYCKVIVIWWRWGSPVDQFILRFSVSSSHFPFANYFVIIVVVSNRHVAASARGFRNKDVLGRNQFKLKKKYISTDLIPPPHR